MDIAWRPRAPHGLARWPSSLTRRLPGRPRAADAVLAVGLIVAVSEPGFDPYHHDGGTIWAAAGVLGAAALAWRRVSPRIVWLIATVASTWLLFTRHGPDWGGLSPLVLIPSSLIALYTLTSRMTGRGGSLATAVTLTALEAGLLSHPVRPEAVATTAVLAVCAWGAGAGTSARTRALHAERVARDLRAAAQERARIARELHDIVAHHVSVISLQAGTARLLAQAGKPPDAELLSGIETASRQAMTELRHALGVITHTPGGAEPLPGLARLGELTAGSGLAVTVDGTAGPLPAAVDLAAYRVIQESLTNVLRHSAATAARVTLRRRDGALHVTVTDDGPPRSGARGGPRAGEAGGHGLRGLRERVAAHGGTFRAGPRDGDGAGGFEVLATLPVPDPASDSDGAG
jgi:signal transduction histidine kinase